MQKADNTAGQEQARVATIGVLASAALVGSHCVGALLFAAFGTTFGLLGAVHALEPYRGVLIAAGFAFWGFGFYRLYFQVSEERSSIAPPSACRRVGNARTLLWLSLCVLVTMSILPAVAAYLAG